MKRLFGLALALSAFFAAPVQASQTPGAIWFISFKGDAQISDGLGLFGTPGATLTNAAFDALFVPTSSNTSPRTDLTINNITFALAPNAAVSFGSTFYDASASSHGALFDNLISVSVNQALGATPDPNGFIVSTVGLSAANRSGTFSITQNGVTTSGTLLVNSVNGRGVPEPSTWLTMITGFVYVGVAMRHALTKSRVFDKQRSLFQA